MLYYIWKVTRYISTFFFKYLHQYISSKYVLRKKILIVLWVGIEKAVEAISHIAVSFFGQEISLTNSCLHRCEATRSPKVAFFYMLTVVVHTLSHLCPHKKRTSNLYTDPRPSSSSLHTRERVIILPSSLNGPRARDPRGVVDLVRDRRLVPKCSFSVVLQRRQRRATQLHRPKDESKWPVFAQQLW